MGMLKNQLFPNVPPSPKTELKKNKQITFPQCIILIIFSSVESNLMAVNPAPSRYNPPFFFFSVSSYSYATFFSFLGRQIIWEGSEDPDNVLVIIFPAPSGAQVSILLKDEKGNEGIKASLE